MMIIFWLLIALMTLVAISIVVIPLLRNSAYSSLVLSSKPGVSYHFSEAQTESQQAFALKIKVNIHNVADTAELSHKKPLTPQVTLIATLLALVLAALAIVLYLKLGASPLLVEQQKTIAQNKVINNEINQLGSLNNVILELRKKVTAKPDGQGWLLLGRLYLKAQKFDQARQAFAQANKLTPNQPDILVGYAESLYLLHNSTLTSQAKQLLNKALKLQPNYPDALNLLAMNAYQHKKYAAAIGYWEQLLKQPGLDNDQQQKLLDMVAAAQKQIAPKQSPNHAKVKLNVQVYLAADLMQETSPEDTVFIYAQAVGGAPMPLAVTRRQVKDLPLKVILDDSMAMVPGATLATADKIQIFARVSKSGQPTPAAGDLEGSSSVIDTHHIPQSISIDISQVHH